MSDSQPYNFDVRAYVEGDVLGRHPCLEEALCSAICNDLYQKHVSRGSSLRILDIGAANGDFTEKLVQRIERDLSMDRRHITTFKVDPFGDHHKHDIIRLDGELFCGVMPSNHIDIVVAKAVIHFFKDFASWLKNVTRILKPGGSVYIVNMAHDAAFPWGEEAQSSYATSVIGDGYAWMTAKRPLPPADGDEEGDADVVHHVVHSLVTLGKDSWIWFIRNRSWSNLQKLSDAALQRTVAFVENEYRDREQINFVMRWNMSVIHKKRSKVIRAKL